LLRTVLIDDERPALDELSYLLKKNSAEVIGAFQNTEGVLDFIVREKPDIVFLDIELREISGIDFGAELKKEMENITIIFITAYPKYALTSFRAYPLDYIVKPVDEEHLVRTLRHVRETLVRCKDTGQEDIYIRCFGGFEISRQEDKIKLPTKKTCELLAYLLCNEGEKIYREDLVRLLFCGKSCEKDANNLRVSLFRSRNALRELGIGKEIFIIKEDLSISIADGVCDVVDFKRFIRNNLKINAENIVQAEKTVGLVNGRFLEDIDALWVTEERESVMARAEELFINMSIFYIFGGLYEKAEVVLLRLLSFNSLSEQGYRLLLDLYIRMKRPLKYRSYYERYREMAKTEFGESLPKMYTNHYKKCMNDVFSSKS